MGNTDASQHPDPTNTYTYPQPKIVGVDFARPEDCDRPSQANNQVSKMIAPNVIEFEFLGINNTEMPRKEAPQIDTRNSEQQRKDELAAEVARRLPGIDLTKRIMHNPKQVSGSVGRKAARMQLKEARKLQLRHLKETGWLDKQRDEEIEKARKK
jgi:hypothetical protein